MFSCRPSSAALASVTLAANSIAAIASWSPIKIEILANPTGNSRTELDADSRAPYCRAQEEAGLFLAHLLAVTQASGFLTVSADNARLISSYSSVIAVSSGIAATARSASDIVLSLPIRASLVGPSWRRRLVERGPDANAQQSRREQVARGHMQWVGWLELREGRSCVIVTHVVEVCQSFLYGIRLSGVQCSQRFCFRLHHKVMRRRLVPSVRRRFPRPTTHAHLLGSPSLRPGQ